MKPRVYALICLILATLNFRSSAQDIEGSYDHPLFNRLPGFSISDFMIEDHGLYTFYADQDSLITFEGKKTTLHYICNCQESPLRIIRTFSNSTRRNGGKSVEFGDNRIYIHLRKRGFDYWAEVYAGENDYFLTVIEFKSDT